MSKKEFRCALSSSCFANNYVSESIKACNFFSPNYVEISAPHLYEELSIIEKKLTNFVDNGFNLFIHNYFPVLKDDFVLNIASNNEKIIKNSKELILKALYICEKIKSPIYGIHAGYLNDVAEVKNNKFMFSKETVNYSSSLDRAVNFINEINFHFENKKVHLILENLFPSEKTNYSLFCSLSQIEELMDQVPKTVGILLDLGHLNISSNLLSFDKNIFLDKFLTKFGYLLREVHISENNGFKDQHFSLNENSWQLNALKKIKEVDVPFERIYCLEARNASKLEIIKGLHLIENVLN